MMLICWLRLRLITVLLVLVTTVNGCTRSLPPGSGTAFCANPIKTTRHELLFGQQRPDSSIIADEEFAAFMDEVVTPLFPAGLTLIDASGQYQSANGRRIEEPTKVLILVYPDVAKVRENIREIITQYLARFRQESVGWVRTAARACF